MTKPGQTRSNAAVGCEISMKAYPTAPTVPLTIVCPHCNMLHIVASHPRMRGPRGLGVGIEGALKPMSSIRRTRPSGPATVVMMLSCRAANPAKITRTAGVALEFVPYQNGLPRPDSPDPLVLPWSRWRFRFPLSRTHEVFIHLLQPAELINPQRQRQALQRRHVHGSVKPVVGLAGDEVEVPVAPRQRGREPKPRQFLVDCLQCHPCHGSTISFHATHRHRHQGTPRHTARTHRGGGGRWWQARRDTARDEDRRRPVP
jgi:hypothetical protein